MCAIGCCCRPVAELNVTCSAGEISRYLSLQNLTKRLKSSLLSSCMYHFKCFAEFVVSSNDVTNCNIFVIFCGEGDNFLVDHFQVVLKIVCHALTVYELLLQKLLVCQLFNYRFYVALCNDFSTTICFKFLIALLDL